MSAFLIQYNGTKWYPFVFPYDNDTYTKCWYMYLNSHSDSKELDSIYLQNH